MSRYSFHIVYAGAALEGSEISVKTLTSAMAALSDLLEDADERLNYGKTHSEVKVKASFQSGSFQIDFVTVQNILERARDFFTSPEATTLLNAEQIFVLLFGTTLVARRSLLNLLKWLQGHQPSKIIDLKNGRFQIYKDASFLVCEQDVLALYQDYKIRKSFEQLIADPLSQEGYDSFAIRAQEGDFIDVKKDEYTYFRAIPAGQTELARRDFETYVQLVRLSFNEKNKWTLADGAAQYNALVEDEDFLRKIEKSEISFSKGDFLKVILQEVQYATSTGLKKEYILKRVLEHKRPPAQLTLFSSS